MEYTELKELLKPSHFVKCQLVLTSQEGKFRQHIITIAVLIVFISL